MHVALHHFEESGGGRGTRGVSLVDNFVINCSAQAYPLTKSEGGGLGGLCGASVKYKRKGKSTRVKIMLYPSKRLKERNFYL